MHGADVPEFEQHKQISRFERDLEMDSGCALNNDVN